MWNKMLIHIFLLSKILPEVLFIHITKETNQIEESFVFTHYAYKLRPTNTLISIRIIGFQNVFGCVLSLLEIRSF